MLEKDKAIEFLNTQKVKQKFKMKMKILMI